MSAVSRLATRKARRGERTSKPEARCLMIASGGLCSTRPKPFVIWRIPVIAIAATPPRTNPHAIRRMAPFIPPSFPAASLPGRQPRRHFRPRFAPGLSYPKDPYAALRNPCFCAHPCIHPTSWRGVLRTSAVGGFRKHPKTCLLPRGWRYFKTILLADLHDPSHVRLALGRRGPLRRRLARFEEELLEAPRREDPQKPAGRGSYVLERVQGATGHVDSRARAPRDGVLAHQELELPLHHVEGFVLAVLDVGRRPTAGRDGALKERESPSGVLASQLQRDQVAYHPHRLAFARGGVGSAHAFRHSTSSLPKSFPLPKDGGT